MALAVVSCIDLSWALTGLRPIVNVTLSSQRFVWLTAGPGQWDGWQLSVAESNLLCL